MNINDPDQPDGEKQKQPKDSTEEKPLHDLTPEEQMARYEESLKEDDWGHQPC